MSTATAPAVLSPRQAEVLALLYDSARDRGVQPTVRAIGRAIGVGSPNGVECHLRALEKKGWLLRPGSGSQGVLFLYRPDGLPFEGFADK